MRFGPIRVPLALEHKETPMASSMLGFQNMLWALAINYCSTVELAVCEIKLVLCKSIKLLPIMMNNSFCTHSVACCSNWCDLQFMFSRSDDLSATDKITSSDAQCTCKTHISHADIANKSDWCSSSATSDFCWSLPWTGGSWRGTS